MKLKQWMIDNVTKYGNTIINHSYSPQSIKEQFKKLGISVQVLERTDKTRAPISHKVTTSKYYLVEKI